MNIDNIADPVHDPVVAPAVDPVAVDTSDDYLKRFDVVSAQSAQVSAVIAKFASQPDDQHRLYAAIDCIKAQQHLNEEIFDLLVEMHNFFSAK